MSAGRYPYLDVNLPDEPALIITTGRGEVFIFSDDPDRPIPEMSPLGAAVLVTRLRWWADRIDGRTKP